VPRVGSTATVLTWTLCLAAAVSAPLRAHRVDEYLQAIRIDLGFDRVLLQIDLTPGAEIADSVLVTIDGDGDGEIAPEEADAYAALVLSHLRLAVDGVPRPLTPVSRQVPSVSEMTAGTGVIRLETAAAYSTGDGGRHTLTLHNDFRPDIGVYLVNALVPATSEITIPGQQRDPSQRTLTLDYEIATTTQVLGPLAWSVVAAAIIGFAVWSRRGITVRGTDRRRRGAAPANLR
jgi:hypothetical protein